MSIILYVQPFTLFGKQFCVVSVFFCVCVCVWEGGGEGFICTSISLDGVLVRFKVRAKAMARVMTRVMARVRARAMYLCG